MPTRGLGSYNLVTRGFGSFGTFIRFVMRFTSLQRSLVNASTASSFRQGSTAGVGAGETSAENVAYSSSEPELSRLTAKGSLAGETLTGDPTATSTEPDETKVSRETIQEGATEASESSVLTEVLAERRD